MKNHRSYPDHCSSSFQGFGAAADDDGEGKSERAADARKHEKKKKKDRSPSPPVSVCDGLDVAEVATTGTWTGEKKTKIQSAPTSGTIAGDDGERSDKIVDVADAEQDWLKQIEGFDWDDDRLRKETKYYRGMLNHRPVYDDSEIWSLPDEKQLTELNTRLALYRLKAYNASIHTSEDEGEDMGGLDENQLRDPVALRDQGYYRWCECRFEWFFDPESFIFAGLQDYQRLMLRNNGEYAGEQWDMCFKLRSTVEADRQYVQFWKKLSSDTKWIEKALGGSPDLWVKLKKVAFYQALKIAADFQHIHSTLIISGFTEYIWSVQYDNIYYPDFAWLYLEIWKRVAKQNMDFKEAVKEVSELQVPIGCSAHVEYELNCHPGFPGPLKDDYETYVAGIGGELDERDARPLIMDAVKEFTMKPKMYYDYAKMKLEIAERIGVIDSQT